jgi:hypothetical protein
MEIETDLFRLVWSMIQASLSYRSQISVTIRHVL